MQQLASLTTWGIGVGAVAFTLFAIAYPLWARSVWWRIPVGWALTVSAWATALLLDLTLVFKVWPPSPLVGAVVTFVVVWAIAAGGLLKVGALALDILNRRRRTPPTP